MDESPTKRSLTLQTEPGPATAAKALAEACAVLDGVMAAAELCGHSPAVHLSAYGRRLDGPGLLAKVAALAAERAA